MLPSNVLSSTPVVANFLDPDSRARKLLVDYELGGIALYDSTEGSAYQVWTLTYLEDEVIATPDEGDAVVLFTLAEITECSLAFDQNMNPFVTYVLEDASVWIWWYDSDIATQVHTELEAGITNPRCTLDDKRLSQTAYSDIILAYLKDGNLYFRQQRDRYLTEYLLATGAEGSLVRIGMGSNLRLHFALTSSGLEAIPGPGPDDPVEILAPFWATTGNWIDLSKLEQTTYSTMFGVTVEGADFNSVFAVNLAALVNTSDAGNRLQIQDSLDCTNAALFITDASGNVLDSMIYAGVPNGDSVLIPADGADYYVVITSDTYDAKIKKWDSSQTSTAGSVPWESYFNMLLDFNRPGLTVYRTPGQQRIIPAEGIAIRFTAPDSGSFAMNLAGPYDVPEIFGTKTKSCNQTVLDFTTQPVVVVTLLGESLVVGMNRPGLDLELQPGATYFFNIRNDNPSASVNYINCECYVTVY